MLICFDYNLIILEIKTQYQDHPCENGLTIEVVSLQDRNTVAKLKTNPKNSDSDNKTSLS